MTRLHLVVLFTLGGPCALVAQNQFVVNIKIERSDGTAVADAEITAYRQGTRIDQKLQQTHVNGYYRFDLPVGYPIDLKIEYVKELNKKYWPYILWSLSGRKQSNDGLVPVVLTTTAETKTPPAFTSALGHVEGAYRLASAAKEYEKTRTPYEEYLEALAGTWQQPDMKKAMGERIEEYNLLGGRLNVLAAQLRRELPVVSSEFMSFPVVKNADGEGSPDILPELTSYTIVRAGQAAWRPLNATKHTWLSKGEATLFAYHSSATVDVAGNATVFEATDGQIKSFSFGTEAKTQAIDKSPFSKWLFPGPKGKSVASLSTFGNMSFYWKADEAWSKPIEVPNVPSFESWAYSPDGKKFAIASGIFVNGRVYVYDLQTGQPILSLTVPEGASGVAFDDALDLYVSSRALHLIRKYDVKKGKFADQQEIVPALLGPLGWDPLHQRLFVPTIKGEIKLLEQFGPSK